MAAAGNRPAGFDYLRILLASCIIFSHAPEVGGGRHEMVALWNAARPAIGLILPMFFALSGFLVAGSLERNKSLISFLGLRIIRLLPALCLEVSLCALILGPLLTVVPLHIYFTSKHFFSYFGNLVGLIHYLLPGIFLQNPFPEIVNQQLWTLPFELKCYCYLAIIAGLGLFSRRWWLLLTMLILQFGMIGLIIAGKGPNAAQTVDGVYLVGSFLAGITLFRFRAVIPWSHWLAVGAGAAALVFLRFHIDVLVPLPATYLTVYFGLLDPPRNLIVRSGDYSYGLYLYGFPIQQTVAAVLPWSHSWWCNLLVSYPVAVLFALFSWWTIEKRALRLKKPLMKLEQAALRFSLFSKYSRNVFTTAEVIREG